jgi:hypothetical protein
MWTTPHFFHQETKFKIPTNQDPTLHCNNRNEVKQLFQVMSHEKL